jgi:hypothetical protein
MSNIEIVKAAVAEYNTKLEELKASVSKALEPALKDLIKGDIIGVRWTQYTPYFNDGDPCEFWVNEVYCKTSKNDEDDGDYEDGFISSYSVKYIEGLEVSEQEKLAKQINEAGELISSIPESVLQNTFGDGYQITVTADGIDVDDYDHD